MYKVLREGLTLSLLLIPMNDDAMAKMYENVYTGCLRDLTVPKRILACRERCKDTYTHFLASKVSESKQCELPDYTCFCSYRDLDVEKENQKNPG